MVAGRRSGRWAKTMIKISMNRVVVPVIGLVMASGIATAVAIQYIWREPVVDQSGASVAPRPVAEERTKGPAALAAAQTEANAVAAALAGSTAAPESADGNPAFDVARIEPSGEAVVAGRA